MRPLVHLVLVPVLVVSSFALAQGPHQHGTEAPPSAPSSMRNKAFEAQMAGAMERMHVAMAALAPTGQPERDFLVAMVPHHQGAIDMAKAVLLVTKDPRIRNLAQSIITEQQYEIELMSTLLAEPVTANSSTPEKHP
jgi:uncharacterized protein (DUF305 family)